jgi:hypothetical protein
MARPLVTTLRGHDVLREHVVAPEIVLEPLRSFAFQAPARLRAAAHEKGPEHLVLSSAGAKAQPASLPVPVVLYPPENGEALELLSGEI